MKYFIPKPSTLEELKALYRTLAMKFHPDRKGGDTETMKAINNEYDELFSAVKNFHKNKDGETYTKETAETSDYFRDVINALIRLCMKAVNVELIGSFLWLSGNTRPYKDAIKALAFKWSTNKNAWYLAPENYVKRSKKQFSMNDIRNMYGSEAVDTDRAAEPALA